MGFEPNYIGGWVGGAGSGKSLSMAGVIIWQLIIGRKVWSNMPVKTGPAIVKRSQFINGETIEYRETEPLDWNLLYMLDESLVEGTIAIDEIGYFADNRQSQSTKNRLINACVRQVRHRNLNLFYTALDFNMVDYRLRTETDFVVTCEDMSFKPWGKENKVEGGIVVRQRYYDVSGKMTGDRQDFNSYDKKPYRVRLFHGRPYWECYDTREIISLEEAFTGVKLDLHQRVVSNKDNTGSNEFFNREIELRRKVFELEEQGIKELSPAEFAQVVNELGMNNTRATRSKLRASGIVFDGTKGLYIVGGGVSPAVSP